MRISLAQLNVRIARDVSPLVELVKGAASYYFLYNNADTDDGVAVRETLHTVVWTLSSRTLLQWIAEARAFNNSMEILVNERLAIKAEIHQAHRDNAREAEAVTGALVQRSWADPLPARDALTLGVVLYAGGASQPDAIARFWLATHARRAAMAMSVGGGPFTMRDLRGDKPLTFWFIAGEEVHAPEAKAALLPFTNEENT